MAYVVLDPTTKALVYYNNEDTLATPKYTYVTKIDSWGTKYYLLSSLINKIQKTVTSPYICMIWYLL